MNQLESYQFRRDMFTNDIQQIYFASQDQTLPNDFFEQCNVDRENVIKILPNKDLQQMDFYIEFLDTEAQKIKNILFQFNNQTKRLVIDIIIKYLEHPDRINVNRDTLINLRQNNPENQSDLMPPTESNISQSPSNLGPPTQVNSQINQQIILEQLPVTKTYGLTRQR